MKLGLLDIIGIVFVVLKLCGVIEWSWVWVLSPFGIVFVLTVIAIIYKTRRSNRD